MKTASFINVVLVVASYLIPVFAQSPAVIVDINNSAYNFEVEPRLSEVLAKKGLEQNWYWPASKLYRLDNTKLNSTRLNSSLLASNSPEHLRSTVLQQLETLAASAKPELQTELNALKFQVANWQLAQRILIPIDYDLARAQAPFNPKFDTGVYKLQLMVRPETVQFWGAIEKDVVVPHNGATSISEYLTAIERTAYADASVVYVIQPDGTVIKVGVANWNRQHIEAMPGALVFVPFESEWFSSELEQLNQNLLALVLHRVVQ
ncbi:MAG: hypothetical protein CML20_08790 [Rheinheimera sp.]|uniref:capsule biosynthesis GfcC family protein n=1 Tax=Arsukibacterium sp. UBA3155 TaxID=1946058 RepID=UPI000C974B31|nr:capsule biosynthesis GfcC family protein [Arsukibacterium sp. UBA3155]MAD74868.1 hypothetical protein [Rheinheimera sp.]|tara:strand:- start:104616 stop:105404 length:789 start_codon:yes stop_codon:yes gene_type:complete